MAVLAQEVGLPVALEVVAQPEWVAVQRVLGALVQPGPVQVLEAAVVLKVELLLKPEVAV